MIGAKACRGRSPSPPGSGITPRSVNLSGALAPMATNSGSTIEASSRAPRHPGLRRDHERWLRQPLPAELAQCRAPIGLEAGDVRTRRGDAERERLPPVLERGVLDVHRDGAVDDVPAHTSCKPTARVPAGPRARRSHYR